MSSKYPAYFSFLCKISKGGEAAKRLRESGSQDPEAPPKSELVAAQERVERTGEEAPLMQQDATVPEQESEMTLYPWVVSISYCPNKACCCPVEGLLMSV